MFQHVGQVSLTEIITSEIQKGIVVNKLQLIAYVHILNKTLLTVLLPARLR